MQSSETEAPIVNPPVDLGYTPPPLEPVPFEDPFADLVSVAQSTLETQIQAFHALPLASRQTALARVQGLPPSFAEGHLSATRLAACGQTALNQAQANLFNLANSGKPEDSSAEEVAALRLFAQILISEILRREG